MLDAFSACGAVRRGFNADLELPNCPKNFPVFRKDGNIVLNLMLVICGVMELVDKE